MLSTCDSTGLRPPAAPLPSSLRPAPPHTQGLVTGGLMILSPTMFRSMGWKGVAATTPKILLVGGVGFFGLCMAYQFVFAGQGGVAAAGVCKRGRGGEEGGGRGRCGEGDSHCREAG